MNIKCYNLSEKRQNSSSGQQGFSGSCKTRKMTIQRAAA